MEPYAISRVILNRAAEQLPLRSDAIQQAEALVRADHRVADHHRGPHESEYASASGRRKVAVVRDRIDARKGKCRISDRYARADRGDALARVAADHVAARDIGGGTRDAHARSTGCRCRI